MPLLFIGHSSVDSKAAIRLRDWLRAEGHDEVFLDLDPDQGLAPGQRWREELREAGGKCAAVLVLVSPDWAASHWCLSEFQLADSLGKRIFPVLVRPTPLDTLPPELIASFQIADISRPELEGDGFARPAIGLRRAGLGPSAFPWPPETEPQRAPYRGLKALDVVDAGILFGRDTVVTAALDALRQMRDSAAPRLAVLLGASGAGKSSTLRAGLVARLENETEHFAVLPIFRPGNRALTGNTGLATLLDRPMADVSDLLAAFEAARESNTARLARFATAGGEPWSGRPPTPRRPKR